MVIVVVDPFSIGGRSGGLRGVVVGIGPFEREGAVETFDLAVGLGPVGAGELVNDVAEGSGEGHRPVAGSVIGYDTLDGDAVGGVKRVVSFPEPGGRGAFLVGETL